MIRSASTVLRGANDDRIPSALRKRSKSALQYLRLVRLLAVTVTVPPWRWSEVWNIGTLAPRLQPGMLHPFRAMRRRHARQAPISSLGGAVPPCHRGTARGGEVGPREARYIRIAIDLPYSMIGR
jgi:hypothetical protein